jgi:plastocyanin
VSENVFWSFASWSSTVTVRVGDTVTWENRGSQFHNVADDGGAFRSGSLRPGQSFSVTFTKAGEYPYTCTLHVAEEMFGKVIVLPAASAPVTPFHVFIPHTPR